MSLIPRQEVMNGCSWRFIWTSAEYLLIGLALFNDFWRPKRHMDTSLLIFESSQWVVKNGRVIWYR